MTNETAATEPVKKTSSLINNPKLNPKQLERAKLYTDIGQRFVMTRTELRKAARNMTGDNKRGWADGFITKNIAFQMHKGEVRLLGLYDLSFLRKFYSAEQRAQFDANTKEFMKARNLKMKEREEKQTKADAKKNAVVEPESVATTPEVVVTTAKKTSKKAKIAEKIANATANNEVATA